MTKILAAVALHAQRVHLTPCSGGPPHGLDAAAKGIGTMDACTRVGVVMLSAAAVLGCASPTRPIDWDRLQAEARLVDSPPGLHVLSGQGRQTWTDGEVTLRTVPLGLAGASGLRLVADVRGKTAGPVPFIVDTGSTGSIVSWASPLADELIVSRSKTFHVAAGRADSGYMGSLPRVSIGSMWTSDLAVGVVEKPSTNAEPMNILGMIHLFHTQLNYDGAWTLRSGAFRRDPLPAAWTMVQFEQGTPFVRIVDSEGNTRFGVIDTGAPRSVVAQGLPEGEYVIPATDGTAAMRVQVSGTAPWGELKIAGYTISLFIGMDVLESRPSRMTFDQGVWAIAPSDPR
ncbi:MAG: retroviral-like aspartic protease family protein [Planctomycetes bacterium]|nr:retroviral-like aspartic protease family protein [Planctomycetota bacterium]